MITTVNTTRLVPTSAPRAKASLPLTTNVTSILHRTPRAPPIAVAVKGICAELEDGRKVIDAAGGAAVTCIGNGHPDVIKAIKEQADKFVYVHSIQMSNKPAEELAKTLVESSGGAFELCGFVSGGSEAMEAAMKTARQYFYETKQPQRKNFIARYMGFHGNTLGTLSLAMHPSRRALYEAILNHEQFHHVAPAHAKRMQRSNETTEEYVERLRQELDDKFVELGPDTVVAFVAETVVGAAMGVVPAPKGYFKAMKSVCDKYGALLILDEVMCGVGRMGSMHAWESFGDGVAPDLQAIAKGLGGGYGPIGAVLMSKKVANGIRDHSGFWKHGHTYQAHPLACAAALAVQKVIQREDLLTNCRKQGEYMASLLRERLLSPDAIAAPFTFDVRGGGLFWGIEFDFSDPATPRVDLRGQRFSPLVQARCFSNGLSIMAFAGEECLGQKFGDICLLAPAYNMTGVEVERIADLFVLSVEQVLLEHIV